MGSRILVAKGIYKSFGGVQALKDVDFEVAPSEIHCLVGENGSGKSTFVKVISGVHQADKGIITLNGNQYGKLSVMNAIREGVQVIYQDLSLFEHMSVAENIATNKLIGLNKKIVSWKYIYEIAEEQLNKIGIDLNLKAQVEPLSVSNKQLIAICRALSMDAKILFMDEPTSALTKKEVDRLLTIVNNLKAKGMSIVFISHKLEEVIEVADRVTVFRDGVVSGDFCSDELDEEKLIFHMTGKGIEYGRFHRNDQLDDKEVLKVEHLTRLPHYEDISMELHSGEVLGITGLLGSGRTEFALSLFGLNPPDSGRIILEGREYAPINPREAIKHGVALVPEERQKEGVYMRLSIEANSSSLILGKLSGKLGVFNKKKSIKKAELMQEGWNVKAPDVDTLVAQLSGGNQQKVALGRWIQTAPKVLILDSPTVGVDIASKTEIYEKIQAFAKKGSAVIIISDEIPELIANCNRIMVFKMGRASQVFNEEALKNESIRTLIQNAVTNVDVSEEEVNDKNE